jgi:hypothetical protein
VSPDLTATEHDSARVDGRVGLVGELLVENASDQAGNGVWNVSKVGAW